MPTPGDNESRDDFLDRCIPMLIDEGKPQDQAVAQCISIYENRGKNMEKLKDGIMTKHNDDGSVTKYVSIQKVTDLGDRTLRFVISDESMDRDKEVVKASGWKFDNYLKAPVVLAHHNYAGDSVARTLALKINSKKETIADVKFPEKETSKEGDFYYRMYKEGFMFATSVGFQPEYDKITFGDVDKGEPYATYNGQELLEFSLVSVPSNPNALIKSMKKGAKEGRISKCDVAFYENLVKDATKEEEPTVEVKSVEVKEKTTEELIDQIIEKLDKFIADESKEKSEQITKCIDCGHELKCPECDSEDFDGGLLKKYFSVVSEDEDSQETVKETKGRFNTLFKK